MNLGTKSSAGYAMAALLVAMSVMAILLSVALPTWSHTIRREKEEELIFRGTQYARAINLYQRKFANASPQSLDILIEQRMLRKKFKDPLSPNKDGEFQMLYLSAQAPIPASSRGGAAGPGASGGPSASGPGATQPGGVPGLSSGIGTKPTGGIVGVASKNPAESIRPYRGKTHYNEWQFLGSEQSIQAGGPARGGPSGIGGRGGRGRGDTGGRQGSGSFGERGSPFPARRGSGFPPPSGGVNLPRP
jgi:type II secretory pathway pseudopilin PulG